MLLLPLLPTSGQQCSVSGVCRGSLSGGPVSVIYGCVDAGQSVRGCPLVLDSLPGCQYRMTSYNNTDVTDMDPTYGLQLHHPHFLENVGVPESACLHHMDREEAVSAALPLQHDAG